MMNWLDGGRIPEAYKSCKTIIFDLETSGCRGLSIFSTYNRIVQISAIDFHDETKLFDSFVTPGIHIPARSSEIHRVYDKDAAMAASNIKEVWSRFLEFYDIAKDDVCVNLIAHNCFGFDRRVLRRELERFGVTLDPQRFRFFDTLPVFRSIFKGKFDSFRLGDLYSALFDGKELEGAHRADVDVRALRSIILKTLDLRGEEDFFLSSSPPACKELVEVKYIKSARAAQLRAALKLSFSAGIQELRAAVGQCPRRLDDVLCGVVGMKDVSHRLFALYDIFPELEESGRKAHMMLGADLADRLRSLGLVDDVDLFVHHCNSFASQNGQKKRKRKSSTPAALTVINAVPQYDFGHFKRGCKTFYEAGKT